MLPEFLLGFGDGWVSFCHNFAVFMFYSIFSIPRHIYVHVSQRVKKGSIVPGNQTCHSNLSLSKLKLKLKVIIHVKIFKAFL